MEPINPFRCYDRRHLIEALLVAVLLMGLALLSKRFPLGSAPRVALGLGQGLLFGLFLARMLVQIRRLDELGQRIQLIAIAFAFGLTGLVLSLGQFLALAGIVVPQFGTWILSFMLVVWGIAALVIARRYR